MGQKKWEQKKNYIYKQVSGYRKISFMSAIVSMCGVPVFGLVGTTVPMWGAPALKRIGWQEI